jgi:hypothetical protein
MGSLRDRAEAFFTSEIQPAKAVPLQLCSMPGALQDELDRIPAHYRQAAFRVAVAPNKEARQRIWIEVPTRWRDDVAAAIGLMLGAAIGPMKPWTKVLAAIEDVPEAFRAEVEHQARRVYEINLPRRAAAAAPERD